MSKASDLYKDGVIFHEFKNSRSLEILFEKIAEMNEKPVDGFFWKEKYPNTEDFRPSVYEYDSSFIDILFDNDIPKLINDATHKDLCLAHIQLRRVFPGPSYMSWHRDTHFKDGDVVSSSPPAYKIICFPDIYRNENDCISILKGTHICHMVNQGSQDFIAPGLSQFDMQLLNSGMFEGITIKSSKNQFALFDTSILHAANESVEEKGSIRLIYVFIDRDQFDKKFSHKKEHRELNKIFQERCNNG